MSEFDRVPRLYICPTPIGNLADITIRSLEVLQQADLIACEDTRTSGKLLKHYNIKKELFSYHEHNRYQAGQMLIEKMKAGQTVALISDAGMPGINDPGADLVSLCQDEGVPYTVLPGASAFITALVYSGMDSSSFCFRGFFPKSGKEKSRMQSILDAETITTIFYETPHRITKTMAWIASHWPKREVALIREISKIYEEMIKGTALEVAEITQERQLKGEMVLILRGITAQETEELDDTALEDMFNGYISQGMSKKQAVAELAVTTGIRKNELYQKFARS